MFHQKMKSHVGKDLKILRIGCILCEQNMGHSLHDIDNRHTQRKRTSTQNEIKKIEKNQAPKVISHKQRKTKKEKEKIEKNKAPKVDTCDCLICGKGFKTFGQRVKHYTNEHPNERIFNCEDCKYRTNYLPNLKTHKSSKHENKALECPQCPYVTTWNPTFHKHMRNVHGYFQKKSKSSGENKGQAKLCEDCGLSTFNKSHKKKGCDKKRVSNIQPLKVSMFKCNKCTYKSGLASDILLHVNSSHSEGD